MKYVIQDRIIQVNSPHTNKKYFSRTSAWNQHLGLYHDRLIYKKVINANYALIDIKHSNVEGETLSIWFDREAIVIE